MKDFATLLVRGVVGICSIVATAVVSVFVQRYLYSMNGSPPAGFSPALTDTSPANSPPPNDVAAPPLSDEPAIQLESAEPNVNPDVRAIKPDEPDDRSERTDRPSHIMEEFWQKLNR